MALQYDINKIFAELEQQVSSKKRKNKDKKEENKSIESPEDAPETQEVAPATSKTSEETHGGDEASKEIKDSPNSADDGENSNEEKAEQKSENVFEKNKESENKEDKNKKDEDYFITSGGKNPAKNKPNTTPENLQKIVEHLFEEKRAKQENFKNNYRQEYLKKYILEIVKMVATKHAGIDKQDGSETFDKRQMLLHMLKKQNYKLLGDKYELRDARYVQFFIDTSGVYGCGSNKILHELMPEVIGILERQGYECYIAACANGFYQRDMVEDDYYKTRKTLEEYRAGKVSKIACPTVQTAAKMANEAEFSIILADFDGLSSICEMAKLCQKDKVPYFLCTEDRYPWEDPTLHSWVDENYCEYNPELVYDVSMNGNPSLDEYEKSLEQDYYDDEYDQDDGQDYDD